VAAKSNAPYAVLGLVGFIFMCMMAFPLALAAGFSGLGGTGGSTSSSSGGTLNGDCDYKKILQEASAGSAEGTAYFNGTGLKGQQPPKEFIPYYASAADHSKLGGCGASILAGIHGIETHFAGDDYGTVNSSGAGGPFQFLESTWATESKPPGGCGGTWPQYGVKNGACAAANYLKNSGAPKSWRDGIYAYNHADWYVTAVVLAAQEFAGATDQGSSGSSGGGSTKKK
jgi:hypothetical protein